MSAETIDPDILLPSGDIGRATNYPEFYDAVIAAINDHAALIDATNIGPAVFNVKDYGAVGDGVTDDRSAITAAAAAAKANGVGPEIVFPPGTYVVSRYVDFEGFVGLRIKGSALAVIRYPSDDTAVVADAVAVSDAQARSGFLVRNSNGVQIEGLCFLGGNAQEISLVNIGCGVYATHCEGVRVRNCLGIRGFTLYAQDAQAATTGTGDSLSVASGVVTLTDADATFSTGSVMRSVTVTGATNQENNGTFLVTARPSATSIQWANAEAVAETSSLAWTLSDADRDTRIEGCRFIGCRGPSFTGNDGVYSDCHFEQPSLADLTGLGDSLSISGSTVTLTDAEGRFLPSHGSRYIRIAGATSPGNDGLFRLTYISSTQVSWTNASGVTERFTGSWWIQNGEKTGIGAGSNALSLSGSTVTLTASAASFDESDIGKAIRITHATTPGNNGHYLISAVPSSTQVSFLNAAGASETFAQGWAIDSYDNRIEGSTYGSSHAIYVFAGRTNILVEGCTFRGIRTVCLKASGSASPIRGVAMRNCVARECGALFVGGADDVQEHTALSVEGNTCIDVATGRPGWSESVGVLILGSRNVTVKDNLFHYTRNAIAAVDGHPSLAGIYAIQAARYVLGRSQPVEDVTVSGNKFTRDPNSTQTANIAIACIVMESVGIREFYGADAVLNKSGSTMTLSSAAGLFSRQIIGSSITLVNSASGNDGTFTVLSVPSNSTLTFTNAGGTGGDAFAGTFRISPSGGVKAGACDIRGNQILGVGATGILCENNIGPTVSDNMFSGCEVLVQFEGDLSPTFYGNREIGRASDNAGIRLNGTCAWPIIYDNKITNNAIGPARGWGMQIGVGGGTPVDFPLLGARGRALPSDGKEEVVIAYGSGHVDGDSIIVDNGTDAPEVYVYRASGPTGNEFNSFSGLVALIAAQTGIDCTDYGTGFEDSAGSSADVATYHLRIRAASASADTDGTLTVVTSSLVPTALVALPNTVSPNATVGGRGSGSTGPVADKIVIWSPMASFDDCPTVVGDNAAAQAIIVSDGYRKLSQVNGRDGGSNDLIITGTTAGTEQFRWRL